MFKKRLESAIVGLDRVIKHYVPDPFVIAILLTLLVFILASVFTQSEPLNVISYWGEGLWSLLNFTLQMVMVLLLGYILALSEPVKKLLEFIAGIPKNANQALILGTLSSLFIFLFNWGLGLMAAGFLSLALFKRHPKLNFGLLIAASYAGMLVWHGGFSGSIPLVLASEDSFSFKIIGRTIPVEDTLFSGLNLACILSMLILVPLITYLLGKLSFQEIKNFESLEKSQSRNEIKKNNQRFFKDYLMHSALISNIISAFILVYLIGDVISGKFSLNLNYMNLIIFALALTCHKSAQNFLNAAEKGASKIWPLLIQYPLYAGIMGIMAQSGLAENISEAFVAVASEKTFVLLTFYSAGLVNFFVPSGGGQWAVQAPVVIDAARALGVPLEKAAMAVAWGDAWTNMAQPFWAVPLLAIAGLKIGDILGYCLIFLITSGLALSCVFLFF